MKKLAICTTFPNALDYPKETLPTWLQHLPEELPILIGLDPCPNLPRTEEWLLPLIKERTEKKTLFISREFQSDQVEFLKRNKEKNAEKDYRLQYVRFSFKVFTLYQAMLFALEDGCDYLIWMDADIAVKKSITFEDFDKWLPKDKVASYLGRKDWDHSECGFMIFNLKNGGKEFITRLQNMYLTDEVLTHTQWHDSFIFDRIRDEFNAANSGDVFFNLTEHVAGRDVFDDSVLAEFMEHKKGNRKFGTTDLEQSSVIDLKQLKVLTKNCVNHDVIIKNVTGNLALITNWLDILKPHKEEVVVANAGPSLKAEDIMPLYKQGVKVVAVKHALEILLDGGITPWACVLLDPREHVADFVKHPKAKDIKWFVASMVSPEVTKILLEQGCEVYGYHAYVGAEEQKIIPKGHKMVLGGSATATRGIAVLDMLGFKKFHLFAYDLCALEKPDLTLMKGDRPIWMEVVLKASEFGKEVSRTFWTKGEFMAQVQEIQQFFEKAKALTFHVYGDPDNGGIVPWLKKCFNLEQKYLKHKNAKLFKGKKTLNQFFN